MGVFGSDYSLGACKAFGTGLGTSWRLGNSPWFGEMDRRKGERGLTRRVFVIERMEKMFLREKLKTVNPPLILNPFGQTNLHDTPLKFFTLFRSSSLFLKKTDLGVSVERQKSVMLRVVCTVFFGPCFDTKKEFLALDISWWP